MGFLAAARCIPFHLMGCIDIAGTGYRYRVREMRAFRAAGYGPALAALHFESIKLSVLLFISGSSLFLGLACYFVLGIALYRGRKELLPDDA